LYARGTVQVWHVYVLMFLRATGGMFHWPEMQASTPLMVPEKHLTRVAGMNQALQGLTHIVIPPLGALLYKVLPMAGILAIDVVTAVLAIGPLLFIAIPQPRREETTETDGGRSLVLSDVREGLRFVWGWPGLVIILAIAVISNLLANPAFALVPLLVSDHVGGGALELGWVQSAFGIGVVVGGLALGIWGGFRKRMLTATLASIVGGIAFMGLGLAPANAILLAVVLGFSIGFVNPILNGSIMAMFQAIIPPEMQGCVFTLMLSISGVTTPLGLAIAGPVGDTFGLPVWFLLSGVITAAMGILQLFVPAVMRIEDRMRAEASGKGE